VILTVLFGCAIARFLIGSPSAPVGAGDVDPGDEPAPEASPREKLVSPPA
jgi:hypothetical protein